MKTIVNLVDDYRPGGIRSLLEDMGKALSAPKLDWRIVKCDPTALPAMPAGTTTIIIHYSMAWRKLPEIIRLRLRHPRARLIIVEHHYTRSFDEMPETKSRRLHVLLKQAYRLANQVIAVSKAQRQWMLNSKLVERNKLMNISACRDYSRFLRLPLPLLDKNRIVIGAYGRLASAKGFDVLIDALDYLPPNRFRLLIAGEGEQESLLRQQASERHNIEFVGHVDDPQQFLSRCDLVAVPSRCEAFGLVCAEGKAAGRPVVVSSVDGLPEQAARCGEIVPPESPEELAAAIERICDPDRHSLLSTRARESVRFSWSNYLSQWSRLLA